MYKHIYQYKKIIALAMSVVLFFFVMSKISAQEIIVNPDSLYVTGINSTESFVTPYISPNISTPPQFCGLINFEVEQSTNISMRYREASNGEWFFTQQNGSSLIPISPENSNINIVFGSNLELGTLYEIDFLEYDTETEEYHAINLDPEDPDKFFEVCLIMLGGAIPQNCSTTNLFPNLLPSTSGCTMFGLNFAFQQNNFFNSNENPVFLLPTATISNISTTHNSISFMLSTLNIEVGESIFISYSTNENSFTNDDYSNTSFQSKIVTSPLMPITISSLEEDTNYFVSVHSGSGTGFIILNTSSNLPYVSITTQSLSGDNNEEDGDNNQSGGNIGNTAENISINVDSGFNTGPGGQIANEVSQLGLVQCGFGEIYDCDFNALLSTVNRILRFLTFVIALPLAALLFAFAGIRLIVAKASAKQAELTKAKEMLSQVVKGVVIMLSAWIIVQLILVALGYNDSIVVQILNINLN